MKPLAGQRVVITRAAHQAVGLATALQNLGAEVLPLPLIQIAPPENPLPLQEAAASPNRYDWIVFTSSNAVEAFAACLPSGETLRARIAVVGESTRKTCEQHHWPVSLVPDEFVAEALVLAFRAIELRGSRVLIPAAAVTRDVIAGELRKMGAQVDAVEAYRNVVPPETARRIKEVLQQPYPDWILFASSSAVMNLVRLAGSETLNQMKIATIGPITSATARSAGLRITAEATRHDAEGMVEAILASRSPDPW